ncbi:MAG: hypothetical protein ACLFP4_03360 [Spirochaetales bacterium]
MNRQYRVKGVTGIETYIELLSEEETGFQIRLTSVTQHGVRESCEFMSHELIESCIRTGYLCEIEPTETMDPAHVKELAATA